jgi:redox-sensitive bicupin YhaK (pirin superfamily)
LPSPQRKQIPAGAQCASGTMTKSRRTAVSSPHAHANVAIITYVRDGAVTHRDSLGRRSGGERWHQY